MPTDLSHLGLPETFEHDEAEEIANAVQDDLAEHFREAPGTHTGPESIGRTAYGVVMRLFGYEEDDG